MNRRQWLKTSCGLVLGAGWMASATAEKAPGSAPPRATSGDRVAEPVWEDRLTVTVGPGRADITGDTDKALQAAVEYMRGLGGGTVQVLPGTYRMRNAVRLDAGIRLLGSGPDTVLFKEASVQTLLAEDSDWYDQEITLADPSGFQLGDAVCIRAKNVDTGAWEVIKRTLVARTGNRFKLDRALRANTWKQGVAEVATLFPLVTAEGTAGMVIENLCLDGNKDNNALLDGNYAGGIWLQDCSDVTIRNVVARNYNGDGISWQICHDVLVEECQSLNNTGLGLHPGSGSKRTIIRDNLLQGNSIGLFFCWGVQNGLAEGNTIRDSLDCGISIGHRDHGNIVRNNEINNSGKVGILFRPERGEGFVASDNLFENNRIVDSGGEDGVGVDIQGVTGGNTLARNTLLETRSPAHRIGIRLGADAGENTLVDNRIEGFAVTIDTLR